jgi:hypothetical protein
MTRSGGYSDYVEHPRFGREPRVTGLNPVDTKGTVFCHWHSPPGVRVPDTAIAADVTKQSPATVPVTHYFDARRICRKCERPFLFFAEEQQFWYEELRFPLEADAVECVRCRRDVRRLRELREEYEVLLVSPSRTEAETLRLVGCAVELIENGVFGTKLIPKLRALLKPLVGDSQRPTHAEARTLLSLLQRHA